MNKREVIQQIQEYLQQELTDAPEERKSEIERLLLVYRFLPARNLGPEDVICPAALVELELNGQVTFCFITPQGGGLVTTIGGKPLQVVTPQSPLGEALLGKKPGETASVESRQGLRTYRIVSLV